MPASPNIPDIFSQVESLDQQSQLALLEKLASLIRKGSTNKMSAKLSAIAGLGSSIWSGTDIDQYIDQERQW